ncbi:cytochrome b561 [Altererythrobacter sp. B11]|uniref:YqaA family protein n=1 Tax=Altererythrobacter sp. B11 TaxID=2060312 RepID=UPI000DC6F3E4|nr:YqaA family protein [Altererythrobacter sp. B11]BBC71607.1 cytochrome b561 [Altererythrobacter sp. B11]
MLRRLYDWTMEKAAHRHAPGWLALFSFAESSFFPIPPHPLLGLMCLAEPQKALRFALITTIASVVGGMFGYLIGYFLYESVGSVVIVSLGLSEAFPKAACYLNENASWVIFTAAVTPIPFKLLTITAGVVKMPFAQFLIASIAGRALIFMVVGVLFRLFGAPIKQVIDRYFGLVTGAFLVLLVGGFLAIALLGGGEKAQAAQDRCEQATTL